MPTTIPPAQGTAFPSSQRQRAAPSADSPRVLSISPAEAPPQSARPNSTGKSAEGKAEPRRAPQDQAAAPSLELTPEEVAYLRQALAMLTRREQEVIFAMCEGGTNEAIATRLNIALPTIRTHLMRLNQKLGTTSKAEVTLLVAAALIDAYRRGELPNKAKP